MKLIIIDGLDASGKDTHAKIIKKRFESEGYNVLIRSHPEDDNYFGVKAKKALSGSNKKDKLMASLYYFLDVLRSLNYYQKEKYDKVIIVRYLMGTAYLPFPLSAITYKIFKKILPISQYMFLLDVDPEEAFSRLEKRENKEIFENLKDLSRVREKILNLVDGDWHIIDTNKPIKDAAEEIKKLLN